MKRACLSLILIATMSGCVSVNPRLLDSDQSQVQLRQIQSRAFDTLDLEKTLRASIATLQDLGFVIDLFKRSVSSMSLASSLTNRPASV